MRHRPLSSTLAVAAALLSAGCAGSGLERSAAPAAPDAGVDVASDAADAEGDIAADAGPSGPDGADAAIDAPDVGGPDPSAPGWEAVVLGDVGPLDAVSAVSADAIWAVSGPRVLRWNGVAWLAFGTPDADAEPPAALHGVWSDGVTVVVVGAGGLIARRPASGAGPWVDEASGIKTDLWAIAGRGPDDLVAVGDDGVVLRWQGGAWETRHTRPGLRLRGVFAGAGDGDAGLHAVGSGGQLVEVVGGTWRSTQIARATATLSAFSALDDGTRVAAGTGHTLTALRPTAPAWQGETSNDTRERDVHALVALRDGTLRAFGADGLIVSRDEGGLWQLDSVPGPAAGVLDFAAASGFGTGASSGLMAVGRNGGSLLLRAGVWSAIPTRPDVAIRGLAVDRDGRLWAAGTAGTLVVRDDSGDFSMLPLPTEADLNAVAADPDGGVWLAGSAGYLLHVTALGALTRVEVPVPVDLHDVAVTARHVVAVGRGGTALVWDKVARTLAFRATGTTADLRAVATTGGPESDEVTLWIAGSFGTVLRGPLVSGAFEALETGTGASLHDLAFPDQASADATGWAVGDGGVILRLAADATSATLTHEAPGVFLQAVAVTEAGILAVGAGGTILTRPAAATGFAAETPTAPQGGFAAVVVTPDGVAWLGSNRREASLERRLAPWGVGHTSGRAP